MNNCQTSITWVTLLAALGIGSIIAAIIGRSVAISNHRQNWINELREDLATFLKEIDVLHYRISKILGDNENPATIDDLEKQQDARNSAMLAYRRILMRLNMTETPSIELGDRLNDLMTISTTVADSQRIEAVLNASRHVLSQEWAVTKYGLFTRPIMAFKSCWKKLFCVGRDDLLS